MGVVSLVVGLKLVFSVYLTGLLPQSWMNRNESDYVLHTLEPALETADLAMVLALQVLLNLVFPKAIASSLGRKGGVAAVAAVFLIGCGLVAWPIRGSSTLVATLCISAFAQFYLQQIALSLSVAVGKGLARFKLLGTVGGQAFQLAALFVPALSTPTSLVIILGLSCGLLLHGILDQRSLGDKEQRKTVSTVVLSTTMEKRVTWLWAFLFVVVAFVGLGSEQILDARLKVSLRVAQAFGAHAPMAIHYGVTMGARLVAYFSTGGTFLSPRFMIVLWFISQCVRLVVLRSVADIASLPLLTTGSLIALDKWSGSLGEIALEASLLNLLATHNEKQTRPGIFTMASTTLMCLVAPLESLNGSSAKMIARSAYGTSVPMIVLLSLVPVGCVWRWSERKMRE